MENLEIVRRMPSFAREGTWKFDTYLPPGSGWDGPVASAEISRSAAGVWTLEDLTVDPDYVKQGIGKKTLEAVEKDLTFIEDSEEVYLNLFSPADVRDFYIKQGYQIIFWYGTDTVQLVKKI